MKKISIGIDTSCYTTSITAIDESLNMLFESRIGLKVKEGTIGLRQSDAFFQHVQNVPKLYEELCKNIDVNSIRNIVVSDKPRPVTNSYMPVFTAGLSFAGVIADTLRIPLIRISHQENHLYASMFEIDRHLDSFIGVHISGGTSEVLKVVNGKELDIEILGSTLDLSFGKLIDRIGVYLGHRFPCGKELDKLACGSNTIYPLKLSIKDSNFNISGVENKLKELYDANNDEGAIANTLFNYISKVLIKQLNYILKSNENQIIIMSGGVSANTIIRKNLEEYFGDQIAFSSIKFATDHAIGNAYYGNLVMTY